MVAIASSRDRGRWHGSRASPLRRALKRPAYCALWRWSLALPLYETVEIGIEIEIEIGIGSGVVL